MKRILLMFVICIILFIDTSNATDVSNMGDWSKRVKELFEDINKECEEGYKIFIYDNVNNKYSLNTKRYTIKQISELAKDGALDKAYGVYNTMNSNGLCIIDNDAWVETVDVFLDGLGIVITSTSEENIRSEIEASMIDKGISPSEGLIKSIDYFLDVRNRLYFPKDEYSPYYPQTAIEYRENILIQFRTILEENLGKLYDDDDDGDDYSKYPIQIPEKLAPVASMLIEIAAIIFPVLTLIMGIKYMVASPDEKGKLKIQLVGLLVSTCVTFGAYFIWITVYKIASNLPEL